MWPHVQSDDDNVIMINKKREREREKERERERELYYSSNLLEKKNGKISCQSVIK